MQGQEATAAPRAVVDPNALLIVLLMLALPPGCDAWGLPVRVPLPQLAPEHVIFGLLCHHFVAVPWSLTTAKFMQGSKGAPVHLGGGFKIENMDAFAMTVGPMVLSVIRSSSCVFSPCSATYVRRPCGSCARVEVSLQHDADATGMYRRPVQRFDGICNNASPICCAGNLLLRSHTRMHA